MGKAEINKRLERLETAFGGSGEEDEQKYLQLLYDKVMGIDSDINIRDLKCSPAFYENLYNEVAKGDTIPESNSKNW